MSTLDARSRSDPDDPQGTDGGSIAGWASGTNVVFGIWLVFAPYALHYGSDQRLLWHDSVLGLLIIALAAMRTSTLVRHPWPSWINLVLGAWLVIAPFVLGYVDVSPAFWNDLVVGASVAATAWISAFGVPRRLRARVAP